MTDDQLRWSDDIRPSTAIIEHIADQTDQDPLDMPPLHRSIDADALDELLTHASAASSSDVEITFSYDGFDVTVSSDGQIDLVSELTT